MDVLAELANTQQPLVVRSTRQNKVSFDTIPAQERKELISRAAELMFEAQEYTLLGAATKIVEDMRVALPLGGTNRVKRAVHRRVQVLRQVRGGLDLVPDKENNCPTTGSVAEATTDGRRGKAGRKRKDAGGLCQDLDGRSYKGAKNHHEYREAIKAVLTGQLQSMSSTSVNSAATTASNRLLDEYGIQLSRLLKAGEITGEITSPQRTGGMFVPGNVEDRIAGLVRRLRDMKLPVFPDDVKGWCNALIEGTPAHAFFPEGKATEGWYNGVCQVIPE